MGCPNIWGIQTYGDVHTYGGFERYSGYMNIGGIWMPPKSDNPP